MTTKEILIEKRETQDLINKLIDSFERKTGFIIASVSFTRVPSFGDRKEIIGQTTLNISVND